MAKGALFFVLLLSRIIIQAAPPQSLQDGNKTNVICNRHATSVSRISGFDSSYLPLRVGNVWNARITDGLSYFDTGLRFYRVLDSLVVDGQPFVRCHNLWYFTPSTIDTVRTDSVGNLWRIHGGIVEPIFKFNANPGETWSFNYADSPDTWRMQMTYVGIVDSFQVPEGPLRSQVFRQLKGFYGEVPGLADSWISILVARGVGVVYRRWSQLYQVLYGATIDGALIGDTTATSVSEGNSLQNLEFRLYQNYPNPFNPTTTIRYDLAVRAHVMLALYDLLGRAVATLVSEYEEEGRHHVVFDGSSIASGIYVCRLKAGKLVESRKLILLH